MNTKFLYLAVLVLGVLDIAQAAQPAAGLLARQPQLTQGMFRRQDCSEIGQCVDGSSSENTSGLVINFSGDSSSATSSSSSSTSSSSSSSTANSSPTSSRGSGLACLMTSTNSNGGLDVNGNNCDITLTGSDFPTTTASSSSGGSNDGAIGNVNPYAGVAVALTASLVSACLLF